MTMILSGPLFGGGGLGSTLFVHVSVFGRSERETVHPASLQMQLY